MSENINTSNHEFNKNLFTEFPKPAVKEWREVVEKSLKGATIEEKLVTKTYEGILLQPMYRSDDIESFPYLDSKPGEYPYVRGTNKLGYHDGPWEICQELDCPTPKEFNEVARHDLDKGQTMLKILLDETKYLNSFQAKKRKGLQLSSIDDFKIAFKNINLEEVPFLIETVNGGQAFFALFTAYMQQQNYDLQKIKGCIGLDPLGELVKEGTLPYSLDEAYEMMAEITKWSSKHASNVQSIMIQSHPYHDAGGNAVHEIAFAISTGLDYLREMDQRQIDLNDVTHHLLFSFSIGSNFFMEIAKLRAARMIWAKIVKELGGNENSQKMKIHSRTSAWTKTIYDPYVNILRGTVEAFASVIGGTDSLHVSPFDESIKTSNEFSRRIARNTHLILDKESNVSKVTDPAGGSWYIESLTYSLAEKAWELFQEIEKNGGMYKALQSGLPQEMISQTAEEKASNIKRRKDKVIGTNIYPNLMETPLNNDSKTIHNDNQNSQRSESKSDLLLKELSDFASNHSMKSAIEAANNGATIQDLIQALNYSATLIPSIRPLRIHRGTEEFESIRQNSESYKNKNGHYPSVFVAKYGPIATYKPRTDFVTDFFEVGGFKVIQNNGFQSFDEIVRAFEKAESKIVVICSNDEQYPELVPALTKQIKEQFSDTTILLAGKPPVEEMSLYKQMGVDDFIHLNVNNFEKLEKLQLKGGIK